MNHKMYQVSTLQALALGYTRTVIGTMVVNECEVWAEELGYSKAVVESQDNKVRFYEQMLYEVCGESVDGDTFRCIRMEKAL